MFFEIVTPPDSRPGDFSTTNALIPSSVRAASSTSDARSPFVTHVFVPLTLHSSPSRSTRHEMLRVSVPASGSDNDSAPRLEPDASSGSHRDFCSSVPKRRMFVAHMVCVLMIPDNDIHP